MDTQWTWTVSMTVKMHLVLLINTLQSGAARITDLISYSTDMGEFRHDNSLWLVRWPCFYFGIGFIT